MRAMVAVGGCDMQWLKRWFRSGLGARPPQRQGAERERETGISIGWCGRAGEVLARRVHRLCTRGLSPNAGTGTAVLRHTSLWGSRVVVVWSRCESVRSPKARWSGRMRCPIRRGRSRFGR